MNKKTYDSFDKFWAAYPKKELKNKAKKIWVYYELEPYLPEMLAFIGKAKNTNRWIQGYIKKPHNFLEGGGWRESLNRLG